eukprot:SAG11_NODE_13544_length_650_cov_1.357532_1_plen_87_part_01
MELRKGSLGEAPLRQTELGHLRQQLRESARSALVFVENETERVLLLAAAELQSGAQWVRPPPFRIEPFSSVVVASISTGYVSGIEGC